MLYICDTYNNAELDGFIQQMPTIAELIYLRILYFFLSGSGMEAQKLLLPMLKDGSLPSLMMGGNAEFTGL